MEELRQLQKEQKIDNARKRARLQHQLQQRELLLSHVFQTKPTADAMNLEDAEVVSVMCVVCGARACSHCGMQEEVMAPKRRRSLRHSRSTDTESATHTANAHTNTVSKGLAAQYNSKNRHTPASPNIGRPTAHNAASTWLCFACAMRSHHAGTLARTYAITAEHRRRMCLGCGLSSMFGDMYSGQTAPLTPHKFLHNMWKHADYLAG